MGRPGVGRGLVERWERKWESKVKSRGRERKWGNRV